MLRSKGVHPVYRDLSIGVGGQEVRTVERGVGFLVWALKCRMFLLLDRVFKGLKSR